jgi:hypothetical protein
VREDEEEGVEDPDPCGDDAHDSASEGGAPEEEDSAQPPRFDAEDSERAPTPSAGGAAGPLDEEADAEGDAEAQAEAGAEAEGDDDADGNPAKRARFTDE